MRSVVTGTNPDGASSTTLTLDLSEPETISISAKSIDLNGNTSSCSNSASYTLTGSGGGGVVGITGGGGGGTSASSLVLALVTPASSPNISPRPTLSVSGVNSGDYVYLYSDAACSQSVGYSYSVGTSVQIQPSSTLSVGSHTFYAQTRNSGGTYSGCSTANLTYTVLAPTAPTSLSLVSPTGSPSTTSTVSVSVGGVAYGLDVRLYKDSACSLYLGGYTTATSSSATSTFYLSAAGTYTVYAQAANGSTFSPCSTASVTYQMVAPVAPSSLTLVSPASSPDATPLPTIQISGISSGDSVYLYADAACTQYLNSGYSTGTSMQLKPLSALPVGVYYFYAQIHNSGNNSACSTANLAYTVIAPSAPTSLSLISPTSSPSTASSVSVAVGGMLPGVGANLYKDSACTSAIGNGFISSGSSVNVSFSLSTAATYTLYAQAYNGTSVSLCSTASLSYQMLPPPTPSSLTLLSPASSPNASQSATVQVGGVAAGLLVKLFDDSACKSYLMGSTTASGSSVSFSLGGIPIGTHRFYAQSSVGNNSSACSTAFVQYDVSGTSPGPPQSPGATAFQAVAYQINPQHSGQMAFTGALSFPSVANWSINLGSTVSYPLIANGLAYVSVSGNGSGGYGSRLYAISLATGAVAWGPVAISGTYYGDGLTYDNGKVFVLNTDGVLRAFDAATGAAGWSAVMPGQYSFSAPPTASNGTVYVGGAGSGGTLYAVDERNGNVYWTTSVANGDNSSPTVTNDGVYVAYPCQVYKFNPVNGALAWHLSLGCSGGGGDTIAYDAGNIYVRDWSASPQIYDSSSGASLGGFAATQIPTFDSSHGFFLSAGTLRSEDLLAQNVNWSYGGDGHLISAPIVINETVVIGSSTGKVFAVDALTGSEVWSGTAGTTMLSGGLIGMAAGENYLVVPAGNFLTAWKISGP